MYLNSSYSYLELTLFPFLYSLLPDLALAIFVAESINKASPANIAKLVTLLSHVRVGNADKTLTSKYESLAEKAVFKLSAACNGKDVALEVGCQFFKVLTPS